jgi:AraC-like DNA-binding protein
VYVERAPVAALAGLVSSAWIQRAGDVPYVQRNIPNGSVELRCSLGSAPRIVGPLTAPSVDVLAPGETVVGLRLHPGAAPAVLGMPASELVDAVVAWEGPLGELVASAGDPLAELQAGVAVHSAPDALVLEAVRRMRWHVDDVALVRSSLFISERQLRRRCVGATGLPPKVLHRMLRFQSFLALAQAAIAAGRAPDEEGIAMLAADAGYADQPHLNRECLRLTGATPAAFLGETAYRCADGHDHAASFRPVLNGRSVQAGGRA